MEDYFDEALDSQELVNAQKRSKESNFNFNKLLKEFRSYSKEFFFQISIVSAGILSLSVTFIGFISTKQGFYVKNLWILYLGWFLETMALIGSLFRNYVYNRFGHYQCQAYLVKSRLGVENATLNMLEKHPSSFVNIKSDLELKNLITKTKKQIAIYQKNLKSNKDKEQIYKTLWQVIEYSTLIGFGIGTVTIVLFAAVNLPL